MLTRINKKTLIKNPLANADEWVKVSPTPNCSDSIAVIEAWSKVCFRFLMSHSPRPKSRQQLRLAVQLSAGLMVPMWVVPALAQGVAAIRPSVAMAPRDEREKLAPAVMAPAMNEAEQTANQLAWNESLKRMSEAEADDPSRALAAYKRFFAERTMSPALGVEVGLKIAQLRLKLGDSKGALQTCDVLATKYADEPSAVLLSSEKARVLMEGKQLAQASQCVNEVMPELVALGPSRYREISDLLLKLIEADLDSGDTNGKEQARELCIDVEEIYLQWTKRDTIDHLWQRFEELQVDYHRAGDDYRFKELLPKVGDVVLQMPEKKGNVEGAVLCLEAARWFSERGQDEQAAVFYERIPHFEDNAHTVMSYCDRARLLILNDKSDQAIHLLQNTSIPVEDYKDQVAIESLLSYSYYHIGDLNLAREHNQKAKEAIDNIPHVDEDGNMHYGSFVLTQDVSKALDKWTKTPIMNEPGELKRNVSSHETEGAEVTRRFLVTCSHPVPLKIETSDPNISATLVGNWDAQIKKDTLHQLRFNAEQVVELHIKTGSLRSKSLEAVVTITSPAIKNFQAQMPVSIRVLDS